MMSLHPVWDLTPRQRHQHRPGPLASAGLVVWVFIPVGMGRVRVRALDSPLLSWWQSQGKQLDTLLFVRCLPKTKTAVEDDHQVVGWKAMVSANV